MSDLREQAIKFLSGLDKTETKTASRIKSANKVLIHSVDDEGRGDIIGSGGEVYHATLGTCSCVDWTHRKDKEIPCKHQIALAVAIIEGSGDEEQNAALLSDFKKTEKKAEKKAEKKEVKEKKAPTRHTVAFSYRLDDPRYEFLCEMAELKGYGKKDVCAMCFDIIDEWIRSNPKP